jgi:hypothetical protein
MISETRIAYGDGVGVRHGSGRAFTAYHFSKSARIRAVLSANDECRRRGWLCIPMLSPRTTLVSIKRVDKRGGVIDLRPTSKGFNPRGLTSAERRRSFFSGLPVDTVTLHRLSRHSIILTEHAKHARTQVYIV